MTAGRPREVTLGINLLQQLTLLPNLLLPPLQLHSPPCHLGVVTSARPGSECMSEQLGKFYHATLRKRKAATLLTVAYNSISEDNLSRVPHVNQTSLFLSIGSQGVRNTLGAVVATTRVRGEGRAARSLHCSW